MARQDDGAGGETVGTEAGVFGCEGKYLSVVLGRAGFATFACRTPEAAERAVDELRAALTADHEAEDRLREAFTTDNMVAFLRTFFPWVHVAYYLCPALISLDEVRGVTEMSITGERSVGPWEIV